jgi:hypothetical protein
LVQSFLCSGRMYNTIDEMLNKIEDKKLPPHEMHYSDLTGIVSLKLGDQKDFNRLGAELAGYDEKI